MGTMDVAAALSLLAAAVAAAVIACVVAFGRRRRAQSFTDEVQPETVRITEEEENQWDEDQADQPEKIPSAAEKEPCISEEEGTCLGEEPEREAEQEVTTSMGQHEPEGGQHVQVGEAKQRLEPGKRGGRPRRASEPKRGRSEQDAKPRRRKPEIVCWQRERQWMLAVQVPEEILENPGLTVLQDGSPLNQEDTRDACWCLERAFGQVVVRWNEGEVAQESKIVFGHEGYLLFELSGESRKQGRIVKSPSSGWYLVIAPENWERDEALWGPPPPTPEPVCLTGYQAHFFTLEKDGDAKIAFCTPEGNSLVIRSESSPFELVGTRLNDASEDLVPLFGERPPRIRGMDESVWEGIGTIVVGEGGDGKGKWRTQFSPDPYSTEQALPSEVAARKAGWYFLRFYDQNDDHVQSLDFRFICALREVRVPQISPVPSQGGHRPVSVHFLHEPGCPVRPADGLANIQIERQHDKTTVTVPPDPAYDETRWLVGPEGGPQVEVTVLVERLWWGIGEEHNAPSEWEDQPFTLPRDGFTTSKQALWLRLPRCRWVDEVLVGFEQPRARPYDVKVTEKTVAVPFREFCDSKEFEVGEQAQEHSFRVWLQRDGRSMEGLVAVIPKSRLIVAPPIQIALPPAPRWLGLGRKKTAKAEAVLQNGCIEISINGQLMDRYLSQAPLRAREFLQRLLELPQVRAVLSEKQVRVFVAGSSPTTVRQAKAVAHAIARALMSYDPKLRQLLKQAGFGGARVTEAPTMEREE